MSNRQNNASRDWHHDDEAAEETVDMTSQTYTRQLLEGLSDSDLKYAETAMNRHISTLRGRSKKTYDFEVELCHIQDEVNRRADMARAAAVYAKTAEPGWQSQDAQTGDVSE